MTNKTKAAIEEAAKLPTAEDLINENLGGLELTMDDDMWHFYKDVIGQCIESHTQAHTEELKTVLRELVDWQSKELKKNRSFTEVMNHARRLLK